jgi:hypothetical protein
MDNSNPALHPSDPRGDVTTAPVVNGLQVDVVQNVFKGGDITKAGSMNNYGTKQSLDPSKYMTDERKLCIIAPTGII